MLLSIPQRYILEVLRKVRYIRADQLLMLLRGRFPRPPELSIAREHLDAMLRQLYHIRGDVRLVGDMAMLSGAKPDARRLEAIDVMLELTGGTPADFGCAGLPAPLLLRFSQGKDDLRFFSVGTLSSADRKHLDWLTPGEELRIIWISDSGVPPDGLLLPSGHFFAERRAGGAHRFYGSREP